MTYQLTFACSEKGCRETVITFCEARRETPQQLRQRNPVFVGVRCSAKHLGVYDAASALDITEFLWLRRIVKLFDQYSGKILKSR